MIKTNRKIFGLTAIFTSILLLSLFQIVNLSHAQVNGDSLPINSKFEMNEFLELNDKKSNISSINIDIPSSNWTITDIELNFTDIKLEREINTIENNDTSVLTVDKFCHGLAVQINISKPTTLYGVEMYIHRAPTMFTGIFVQLNNYSSILQEPTNIIPDSQIEINVTPNLNWYKQIFPSPINLPIGNYCLVLNGTKIGQAPQPYYRWFNNDFNPKYPDLFSWEYKSGSWQTGEQNRVFLHKLIQKTDTTYNPESINLTVEIHGESHKVWDGPIMGTGHLNHSGLSYSLDEAILTLPINNNLSVELNFNLNYTINLDNIFLSNGVVLVEENINNEWTLTPMITRYNGDTSVKFDYPRNWNNLAVFRKLGEGWENITSNVNINEANHFIIITNSTIKEGAEWKITANSPNFNFNLIFPNTEWEIEKQMQFSVKPPIIQGNLTFVLINTLGFSKIIEVKKVISEEIVFTFDIPSTYLNGTYIAKVYWNNNTDAGVQSQVFSISIPEAPPSEPTSRAPINPWLIILIVVASVGATLTGFVSYRLVRSLRIKRAEEAQKIFKKCMDILNLDYLMVADKKSGLNVYEQKFTGKEMNGTLISGFLQAIHQFGIELIKVDDRSQTIKLDYANSIVLMTEFVNLRLILIMSESPSKNFLYSLEDLAYDIYKEYGNLVDEFNGDIKAFKGIEGLLREHLNITFIYPLKLATKASSEKIKIKQEERIYINKALLFMKQTKKNYFYIASLLPEKTCSPKDIDSIMDLIEKNIFQPIIE